MCLCAYAKCKNCVYMGGFEMKIPGMGGWAYKFSGSSCVSTQISSIPQESKLQNKFVMAKDIITTGTSRAQATQLNPLDSPIKNVLCFNRS